MERIREERLKETQGKMHLNRQLDGISRKETEEGRSRSKRESDEDIFQGKWNQQKYRIRKGMSAEQLLNRQSCWKIFTNSNFRKKQMTKGRMS